MARLFTALVPPDAVLDDLAAALGHALDGPVPLRAEARAGWHITLGFYGDGDDPATRSAWLAEAVRGLAAPRLRLRGFGTFPKVGWAGVQADDALNRLARATGAGVDRPYTPHLTLARWKQEEQERGRAALHPLEGYSSQWWVATEVVLMASTRTAEGAVYTPVARCGLGGV